MEEFLYTDIESLCAKLKHQEKQLKLKRRQLMGLPLSDYEQKQLSRVKFQENKTVPESFLREDDGLLWVVQLHRQIAGMKSYPISSFNGHHHLLNISNYFQLQKKSIFPTRKRCMVQLIFNCLKSNYLHFLKVGRRE